MPHFVTFIEDTRVINEGTPCIYTKIIMLTDGRPSYSTPDMDDTSEIDEVCLLSHFFLPLLNRDFNNVILI